MDIPLEDIDLDSMKDPDIPCSEYLQKRVQHILTTINCEKDESFRSTLLSLDFVDENFINKTIVQKAKQYDYLPIAYNTQLVTNHIQYTQEQQKLKFYQNLIKDENECEV